MMSFPHTSALITRALQSTFTLYCKSVVNLLTHKTPVAQAHRPISLSVPTLLITLLNKSLVPTQTTSTTTILLLLIYDGLIYCLLQ